MSDPKDKPPVESWEGEPPPGLLPDGTLCVVDPEKEEEEEIDEEEELSKEGTEE